MMGMLGEQAVVRAPTPQLGAIGRLHKYPDGGSIVYVPILHPLFSKDLKLGGR